jgi:hypothetical protein
MTDNAGLRAVISKAQVIDEQESTLPGWVKRHHVMYPAYVHVLKARASAARLEDRVGFGLPYPAAGRLPEHLQTGAGRAGVQVPAQGWSAWLPSPLLSLCASQARHPIAAGSARGVAVAQAVPEADKQSVAGAAGRGLRDLVGQPLGAARRDVGALGPPTSAAHRSASICMARRALPRRRMAAPAPLPRPSGERRRAAGPSQPRLAVQFWMPAMQP